MWKLYFTFYENSYSYCWMLVPSVIPMIDYNKSSDSHVHGIIVHVASFVRTSILDAGITYQPLYFCHNHSASDSLNKLLLTCKHAADCTKKGSTHPSLTPGIFTLSCVHGICYGFQMMEDIESCNLPFTILITRFMIAPKLVIYDNACNLHNYCLNRDPVFFRETWFLVDRFHWCNHKAEQRNSTLKRLKTILSYMNVDYFKNHLRLFLWFRRMISLSMLHPDLPVKDIQVFRDLSKVYSKLKV
ncbi:hypothetical protein ACJMK2_039712 [Sinanodonta woodiana]|uniref:Uncharacterized protein n=1 Tax=Sinanodonta woodiana TaxID=1069815 RepID=A0ABD3WCU8_SINWO